MTRPLPDGQRLAATRFQAAFENALETLASGVADGRPVTLPDGRRVRWWYVRPLRP